MKRILLIEDDQLMGKLYFDFLNQDKEYQVTFVEDGEVAYTKIIEEDWDLILLDTLLPKMNAIDILAKIKKNRPEKLKQKIVIITNLDDSRMLADLKGYNFEILFKSQFNPEQFVAKIKSFL
ncbi:response regulator [Candidatus Roizmanbacteria bacterium]|nr:response regulator [Candidatus Roizmanbacteria bacterium]